jgi:NitT/TauT family transport system permease protein
LNRAATIAQGLTPAQLRAISLGAILVIWEGAALIAQARSLPDLWQVSLSFYDHLVYGSLLFDLGITLLRVVGAFVVAMAVGTAIGIAMGFNRQLDHLFDGWLILFLNIPALVTIILCLIWFGMTEFAAILAVALNKIPNVVVTIREGARAIDRDLLQVAQTFRVGRRKTFFTFFLPQLYPYLMAAGRSGIALIWKIVLVVELLGRPNGIGFRMNQFFYFYDISSLLAYTLAFVVVMLLVEMALVERLERRMTRWRR